jgi:hypothetical protein
VAKRAFFDSDCIKKKTKRGPREEQRVEIVDRAGVKRLAKMSMAMALLQSRVFHVNEQLQNLSGEHHMRFNNAVRTAALGGYPFAAAAAAYDLVRMPSLSIWTAAQSAARACQDAKELKPFVESLDALEKAFSAARYTYLSYRGDNPAAPGTPAPASGATPAPPVAPPVPPKAPATATPSLSTAPKPADAGVDAMKIAAVAGIVVLTFLILQPELGVAAVAAAGAETATGAAATAGAELAAELVVGEAVPALEAGLELASEVVSEVPLLGAAG